MSRTSESDYDTENSLQEESTDIEDCKDAIEKKEALIDVLTIIRTRQQKENDVLREENDVLREENTVLRKENDNYIKLLEELSGAQSPRRGGNNKRIKNVSKHSTVSKRNATRRQPSKR